MHICVVATPGECLRVKADMVLFAGNTVSLCDPYLNELEAFVTFKYQNIYDNVTYDNVTQKHVSNNTSNVDSLLYAFHVCHYFLSA